MKYRISQSQLDKILFKYLDNQDFIPLDIDSRDRVYFVNSDDDEYCQIRYDKLDGWCYINSILIQEISSFFSLKKFDSTQVIGRWVENKLGMEVTRVPPGLSKSNSLLKIPN